MKQVGISVKNEEVKINRKTNDMQGDTFLKNGNRGGKGEVKQDEFGVRMDGKWLFPKFWKIKYSKKEHPHKTSMCSNTHFHLKTHTPPQL